MLINTAIKYWLPMELQDIIWRYYWKAEWELKVLPQLVNAINTRIYEDKRYMIDALMVRDFVEYEFKSRKEYDEALTKYVTKDKYICKPLMYYCNENVDYFNVVISKYANTWYCERPDWVTCEYLHINDSNDMIKKYNLLMDKFNNFKNNYGIRPIIITREQLLDRYFPKKESYDTNS